MITLRPYQEHIAEKGLHILKMHKLLYLALEVRTGKTITALAIAGAYGAESVLFVTKKKAINSIRYDYQNGAFAYDITIINYESLHKVEGPFDLVICDESHSCGAYPKPTQRTKRLRKIAYELPIIYLSGTPSPESWSQLYHQFWISKHSPWERHANFYQWARAGYVRIRERIINGVTIRDYSAGIKAKIMGEVEHLFISLTQEEAGFVAPITEHVLHVEMEHLTKACYRKIEDDGLMYGGNGRVASVTNGADLINKLAQLSGGTIIYDDEPKGTVIDPTKAYFIRSRFRGQKIAIFYKYKAELEILKNFFSPWTAVPEEFNADPAMTFIAQIQSAREGTDLSSADALVMYNIDFSSTSYFQARARIQARGRTGSAPLYWIFSTHGIEQKIYERVLNKKNFTYAYYRKINNSGKEVRERRPEGRTQKA